jgi:DNA repair protein RecO (recombination protein O)
VAGSEYCFIPGEGMLLLDDVNRHALRFQGANLLAMNNEDFTQPQVAKDARIILRLALQRLLGDKPLNTRELLRSFKEKQRAVQQAQD